MDTPGIFLLKDDDEIVEMQEREYDSEALLALAPR